MIAYTVTCTFDDPHMADEWIAWLRVEHLAEVCAAGALDAEVIRMDPPVSPIPSATEVRCEVRYHFTSREAFDVYVRDHSPRLRAAGLKRFPPERGIRYERSLGTVATSFGR